MAHPRNSTTITKPFALLVEGGDDQAVLRRLVAHRSLCPGLRVFEYDGKSKLRQFLKTFSLTEGFRSELVSFGIIRDADDDAGAAVQQIQEALRSLSLPVPDDVLVKATGRPSVAFLVLPGDGAKGCLEDVCLSAVNGAALLGDAKAFVATVCSKAARPPQPTSKAIIHSFLATCHEPGLPLGTAAAAGFIDLSHSAFDQMARLVKIVTAA